MKKFYWRQTQRKKNQKLYHMNWCWTTRLTTGAVILRSTTNTPAAWGKKPTGSRTLSYLVIAKAGWGLGTLNPIPALSRSFQSFSWSLPSFCPILHNVFQAHTQPLVPSQMSCPKLCLDSPSSLGNTRKRRIVPPHFKTQKNDLEGMDYLAWHQ